MCGADITIDNKSVSIIGVYKPPRVKVSVNKWSKFFNQFQGQFMIGGDFNSHHTEWGCDLTCTKGIKLSEALERSDIHLLNSGVHTYQGSANKRSSALDLSIASNRCYLACEWEMETDRWGSDHHPIRIRVRRRVQQRPKRFGSKRIHTNKTDWSKVKKNLRNCVDVCEELMNTDGLDI